MTRRKSRRKEASGRLKIGDAWNAITIIALSQENPLKAIAEFVENSIDARSSQVIITRGRERGEHFLMVADDGEGVPRTPEGIPDFHFVGTHICDSIKRRLKLDDAQAVQGEFGIGLLSFWTVGEELVMSSAGADDTIYEMRMRKGDPTYSIIRRRTAHPGAWYPAQDTALACGYPSIERREDSMVPRLGIAGTNPPNPACASRSSTARARKEYTVKPRDFTGQLLHDLPRAKSVHGDIYTELYLDEPGADNEVGLYRFGDAHPEIADPA